MTAWKKVPHRPRTALIAIVLALPLAAALVVPAVAGASTRTAPASATACGITWGSLPKSGGSLSTAPLITSRTGQQVCYDRLVFEFNGPANGYRVSYASEVYTEGAGAPMSSHTAGGALIGVTLLDPTNDQTGHITYAHPVFAHVANVSGYQTLRDVVYGGSFEGYTTFAVGTRARLPFRVFVLAGPGTHSRIVIDVAHHW